MNKTPKSAIIMMLVLMAFSINIGFFRSYAKIIQEGERQLEEGPYGNGMSVYKRLDEKVDLAYNFATFSEKQGIAKEAYIEDVFEKADQLANHKKSIDVFDASIALTAGLETLFLEYKDLPGEDPVKTEAGSFIGQSRSIEDKMKNDGASYNRWATNRNKELSTFPASLFMNTFNKKPLKLFESSKMNFEKS